MGDEWRGVGVGMEDQVKGVAVREKNGTNNEINAISINCADRNRIAFIDYRL
ncbi:hypothetical protein GHO45_23460 [Pseudomonas sp. FSL R10-0765]|uniref:hypothetical protein n=1 Tax=Pseudomonas sp. FSL R10-0765 TaxID=2662195 RepID=UPI001295FB6F|nr:hypothetical protein [Pseudomonas sp. FSL R10-0765]MQT43879.1 hypothetical protein [Pseudomonas sp. FSL R10-0765]